MSESQPPVVSAAPVDLAQLKEIETQLRRMTKIFMDGADPIVIRDLEGRVLDVNRETERVFGWSREELVGRTIHDVLPEEWRELADRNLERLRRGETIRNLEGGVRSKSGRVVPTLVTSFLLTSESDEPLGIAHIVKDITELRQATDRLERRYRELTQFAQALVHDLEAPLRAIQGFLHLMQDDPDTNLSEQGRGWMQLIDGASERMESMIDELLAYARVDREASAFRTVDCERALAAALANLHAIVEGAGAEVTHGPLPTVTGSGTQLTQLFQNLICNAIRYRRDVAPAIHVSAERDGDEWTFSVRDNGIGIESTHFDRIFQVFQRLHSHDRIPGNGIGLAAAKAIVERHGGRIWVESEPGRGSVFRFTLAESQPRS